MDKVKNIVKWALVSIVVLFWVIVIIGMVAGDDTQTTQPASSLIEEITTIDENEIKDEEVGTVNDTEESVTDIEIITDIESTSERLTVAATEATSREENTSRVENTTKEEPTSVEVTSHIHSFSKATCTEPGVCACGETGEKAIGHSWQSATCTTAKKCVICGITEGNANGHSYSGGECIACGAKDPDYASEVMVWIPTKGGSKYHSYAGCSNMIDPIQVTEKEAISQGYGACAKCH